MTPRANECSGSNELEARGVKDYFFMKGGADAYWEHRFGKSAMAKAKAAPK